MQLSALAKSGAFASTSGRSEVFLGSYSRETQRRLPLQHRVSFQESLLATRAATSSEVGQQFDGLFGKWTLEESDKIEVVRYRAGLTVAALGSSAKETMSGLSNIIAGIGAAGLGASYLLIHIYVTPLKRFLQGLFVVGSLGGLYLMASQELPLAEYVAQHHSSIWLVGPLFASLTGLGIKEGLCYGTPAAIGITFITPILCLGHLSGLMPEGGTKGFLVLLNIMALAFAAGKYSQAIKGDIGDKSIFEVQALPKSEQEERWASLKSSQGDGS